MVAALDALLNGSDGAVPPDVEQAAFEVLEPEQAAQLGNSWRLPSWEMDNQGEQGRMDWVTDRVTDNGRTILRLLTEDSVGLTTAMIAEEVGVKRASVPPMLKAISAYCRRVRRKPCWHWHPVEDGEGYMTTDNDQVALISAALND